MYFRILETELHLFCTIIILYTGILQASYMLPSKCTSASDLQMSRVKNIIFKVQNLDWVYRGYRTGCRLQLDASWVTRHLWVGGFQFVNSGTLPQCLQKLRRKKDLWSISLTFKRLWARGLKMVQKSFHIMPSSQKPFPYLKNLSVAEVVRHLGSCWARLFCVDAP